MKLTQQIHNVLNRIWPKGNGRRVATTVLLWAGLTVAAMAVVNVRFFRVVNGIPHLPVVTSYTTVTSAKPGAIVFDSLIGSPYLYTGKGWISLCTVDKPHYAADSVKWFQVANGYPSLSLQAKSTGASIAGAVYFPTDSTGVQVNDGTGWSALTTFMTGTKVKNTNSKYTQMGSVTGITGAFVIPILSAPPTVKTNALLGNDAGTIYLDSATSYLKYFNGTVWNSLDCSGCPPNAAGITVGGDFARMLTSNDFKTVGYAYYDKDGSAENTTSTIYRWFLSSKADGTGTTTPLSNGTGNAYTFSYVDSLDGKYLNVGVTAFANTGIPTSPETVGHWLLSNCPPQVTGVTVNGDFAKMSSNDFTPGYGYYDKEGNPEKASSAEYRWFLSATPGGAATGTPTVSGNTYTYVDADDGKYINVGVKTKAATGFAQSAETVGSAYLSNCKPQVTALTANGDFTFLTGNTQTYTAGYSYYDKEGNAENTSKVQYQWLQYSNTGDVTILGTAVTQLFTYTDAADSSYLALMVSTKASTGFAQSDTILGVWLIHNCPPQVTGVTANGDLTFGTGYTQTFTGGYSYYDKEGNPEKASSATYKWYTSTAANGGGTTTNLGTSATQSYTYTDADDGKYLNLDVNTMASTGYSQSATTVGSWLISNCPPQVGNVRVAGTLTSGQVVRAEYSYYDKESNAEGTSTYQWYRATSASGTGAVAISGATSAAYTLTTSDKTFFVGVTVTPKAAKGYSTGTAKTGYGATVVN